MCTRKGTSPACRAILVESADVHSYLQYIKKSCNKIQWTILLYAVLIQFYLLLLHIFSGNWLLTLFILMERLCMYTITMIYLHENLFLLMQPFQCAENQRKRFQLGSSYPAADPVIPHSKPPNSFWPTLWLCYAILELFFFFFNQCV